MHDTIVTHINEYNVITFVKIDMDICGLSIFWKLVYKKYKNKLLLWYG